MFKVSYEECKFIWDNKNHSKILMGQTEHIKYVAEKLGIVRNRHKELKDYYNRYIKE